MFGYLTGYALEIALDVAVSGAALCEIERLQSDIRLPGIETP
jgi:hypothetical protein